MFRFLLKAFTLLIIFTWIKIFFSLKNLCSFFFTLIHAGLNEHMYSIMQINYELHLASYKSCIANRQCFAHVRRVAVLVFEEILLTTIYYYLLLIKNAMLGPIKHDPF